MDNVEENKKIAISYLQDVLENLNLELLDEIIHPDYQMETQNPSSTTSQIKISWTEEEIKSKGIEGLRKRILSYSHWATELKHSIKDIVAEKNIVMVFYEISVKHTGEFMGFPPTGKTYKMSGFHVFRFNDGKIHSMNTLVDTLKPLQEIGITIFQEDDEYMIQKYLDNLRRFKIIS